MLATKVLFMTLDACCWQAHACTVAPDCLNAGQLGLGIGTTIQRTGTRISLTIRRVLKVRKGLVQL